MDAKPPAVPPASLAERLWPVVLILLIGGTSLAVASVSLWLVPLYLALMAWMLWFPPRSPRRAASPPAFQPDDPPPPSFGPSTPPPGAAPTAENSPRRAGRWFRGGDPPPSSPPHAPSNQPTSQTPKSESLLEPNSRPSAPRSDDPPAPPSRPTRKRKPRAPKLPAPEPEPTKPVDVVWVRVGPNQFVRKEVPQEASVPPSDPADGGVQDALNPRDTPPDPSTPTPADPPDLSDNPNPVALQGEPQAPRHDPSDPWVDNAQIDPQSFLLEPIDHPKPLDPSDSNPTEVLDPAAGGFPPPFNLATPLPRPTEQSDPLGQEDDDDGTLIESQADRTPEPPPHQWAPFPNHSSPQTNPSTIQNIYNHGEDDEAEDEPWPDCSHPGMDHTQWTDAIDRNPRLGSAELQEPMEDER